MKALLLILSLISSSVVRLSRHQLKALGVKQNVIEIIETWSQPAPKGTHIKFERLLIGNNGAKLRQVLVCSSSSSDVNWGRVVSRDFLKREREKDAFMAAAAAAPPPPL